MGRVQPVPNAIHELRRDFVARVYFGRTFELFEREFFPAKECASQTFPGAAVFFAG
jgi:hypothetical protein